MNPDVRKRDSERRKESVALAARDVAIAAAAVVLVIGSIWWYSGTWPPMVVIESPSMQHADDRSFLGVIDTGDLTLVKKVERDSDITTYMEGQQRGYKTYGAYGDVIIYAKNNFTGITPIIHRALTRMFINASSLNGTAPSYDFPELALPDAQKLNIPWNATNFNMGPVWTWFNTGPDGALQNLTVRIDLISIALEVMDARTHALLPDWRAKAHGGFITKGDHNNDIDEGRLPVGVIGHDGNVQPVEFPWVVGKAEGELPWFGTIKLWASGNARWVPGNSQANLIIAIIVIAVGPFAFETAWDRYGDRVKSRIPMRWREKWTNGWDKLPGGAKRAKRRREATEEREAERKRRGGRRRGGRAR